MKGGWWIHKVWIKHIFVKEHEDIHERCENLEMAIDAKDIKGCRIELKREKKLNLTLLDLNIIWKLMITKFDVVDDNEMWIKLNLALNMSLGS